MPGILTHLDNFNFDTFFENKGIHNVNIMNVIFYPDGEIAKIEAINYTKDNCLEGIKSKTTKNNKIKIINRGTKKTRQIKTLEKVGLTKEEFKNGKQPEEFENEIVNFLNMNPGTTFVNNASRILNIIKKTTNNTFIDIKELGKRYAVTGLKIESVDNIRTGFNACLRKDKKIKRIELNRPECKVISCYYGEQQIENKRSGFIQIKKYLFCKTSIGTIYYDIVKGKWAISQKEKNRTGFIIESFDTSEITKCLCQMYKADSFDKLKESRYEYWKSKHQPATKISA